MLGHYKPELRSDGTNSLLNKFCNGDFTYIWEGGGKVREGGGKDTNVYNFLSYPYVCLWLLSPCQYQFHITFFLNFIFSQAGKRTLTGHSISLRCLQQAQ